MISHITRFIRALFFDIAYFSFNLIYPLAFCWTLLLPRRFGVMTIKVYLFVLRQFEYLFLNLRFDLKGLEHLPKDTPCIVAMKHQSTWETLKLHYLLGDPAIVLKKELMKVPVWGWYPKRTGMIPVDRSGTATAMKKMLKAARKAKDMQRPILIFPQGTRVAPGVWQDYRAGVGALYRSLNMPVIPVALNSGYFWQRNQFFKRSGRITVEFLPAIPPGLDEKIFVQELEYQIETNSDRLMAAVGGPVTQRPADAKPLLPALDTDPQNDAKALAENTV